MDGLIFDAPMREGTMRIYMRGTYPLVQFVEPNGRRHGEIMSLVHHTEAERNSALEAVYAKYRAAKAQQ